MARNPPAYGLPLLAGLLCAASASAIRLPDDVSRLIPGCARGCFMSFVLTNYALDDGGGIPSLAHLCSTRGASEFTVGEGAVQCLVAEKSVGSCSQDEASAYMISKALRMCNGRTDAVRPTHSVITATLLLPPDGRGPVSFPAPKSSKHPNTTTTAHPSSRSMSISRSRSSPWTTVANASTSSVTHSSSTAQSTTSSASVWSARTSSSTSETSTATTPGAAGHGDGDEATPRGSLNAGQKAGIAVGVLGLAGLAIGILALFRCYRKIKSKPHPSDSTEALHRRETWGYNVDKGGSSGGNSWMAQPIRPPPGPDESVPPARTCNQASTRPSPNGLAISPSYQKQTPQTTPSARRMSKLLPAKPVMSPRDSAKPSWHAQDESIYPRQLRLVQPSPPSSSRGKQQPQPRASPRPHASEPDGPPTAAASQGRESAVTEFEEDGRTPQTPQGQIWKLPTQSATTYYVSDRHGNWVLGDANRVSQVAELDAVTPTTPKTSVANAVLLPLCRKAQQVHQPPSKSPRLPSAEASAEATRPSPSCRHSSPEIRQEAIPRPLFSTAPNPRHSTRAHRSSTPSLTRQRVDSGMSGSTIFEGDDLRPLTPPQAGLSPVAESPRPAVRIHPSAVPAPPRRSRYHPPGQPSPTLGSQCRPSPYKVPPRAAATRGADCPTPLTTRLPTVRLVEPSPEPDDDDRSRLPSAGHRVASTQHGRHQADGPRYPPQSSALPAQQQLRHTPPPNWLSEYSRPHPSNTHWYPQHHQQPPPRSAHLRQQPLSVPHPARGRHPPSSSLIAKRLGTDRAAGMAISTHACPSDWRRHSGGPMYLSPELVTPWQADEGFSATPSWVPRLTPTRRGDYLYPNAH